MLEFLKRLFAGKELTELSFWRRTTEIYLREFESDPHFKLLLVNLLSEVKFMTAFWRNSTPGVPTGNSYYNMDNLRHLLDTMKGPCESRVDELESVLAALITLRTLKKELEESRVTNDQQEWWKLNYQQYLNQREELWERALKVLNKP